MKRTRRLFRGGQDREEAAAAEAEAEAARDAAAREEAASRLSAERIETLSALPLWTDSHCHLQSSEDLEGMLERGRESGTRRMVFVGTDEATSREAATVAAAVTGSGSPPVETWSTVGLHPHDASTGVGGVGRFLRELYSAGLSSSRVVAVGECGLDYHYNHSPRASQRDAFAAQIGFAHQFGLALVIHTREAWDDTFSILDREGLPGRFLFHCFTGGAAEAQGCLDRGAYLSFSGIVTFSSAAAVREAATMCPVDRLLVETDAPFLTPVPHRGKPNESSYVPLVGAQIAALKGLEDAVIAQATTANAAVVFDLRA
jgi:TatD DNase family protein